MTEHFPSRYFVSCEAVSSASALVGDIANACEHLINLVLSFRRNAVLCLNNFETIWSIETARVGGLSVSPQPPTAASYSYDDAACSVHPGSIGRGLHFRLSQN